MTLTDRLREADSTISDMLSIARHDVSDTKVGSTTPRSYCIQSLVYGIRFLGGGMTSTDGVELTSTINTDLPWKTVAKGSRSSTRRNKNVAASEVETGASCVVGAEGVSQSKKLGVSVPGQHIPEKIEHVPIKKRKFIVHSGSPSNRSSCRYEGLEHRAPINHVSRLNPNLIDKRTPEALSEKSDGNDHEFSGIDILADVACSSDISDKSTVRDHLINKEPVQQQIQRVGNGSSDRTASVSCKVPVHESQDQAGENKSKIEASLRNSADILDPSRMASGEMVYKNKIIAVSDETLGGKPKGNIEAEEREHLALQDRRIESFNNIECPHNDRVHWDLNLSLDAWDQPGEAADDASQRDAERKVTKFISPIETEHAVISKDHVDDGHVTISSTFVSGADTVPQFTKELQSDYDYQFEDGELRESYPFWDENEGDGGEVEQVDYGSDPAEEEEEERLYDLGDDEDNKIKIEDVDKGVLEATKKSGPINYESGDVQRAVEVKEGSEMEKHVVGCLNDAHVKDSSPSRSFCLKPPFKQLPMHDVIPRRRYDICEESDTFVGRERSGMHMRRGSSLYKGSLYGFGHPLTKNGLVEGFDQAASGPNGHLHRHFLSPAYRGGWFRRYPDGGFKNVDRGFPCDASEYSGHHRMHYRDSGGIRERSKSPVLRKLHYTQPYWKSRSRSRSRSPVSWIHPSPSSGLTMDDRIGRVRVHYQKRFPVDQEFRCMWSPRNQMSSQPPLQLRNSRGFKGGRNSDAGENHKEEGLRMRKVVSPHHHHHPHPARVFRERFESGNGMMMRRVNSESGVRPMMTRMHQRWYDRSQGRSCKYQGSNSYHHMADRHRPVCSGTDDDDDDHTDDIGRLRFHGQHSEVNNNSSSRSR